MSTAQQAAAAYTPAPLNERQGIGLCLSGGGFRATLFHLGALRRLNELGLLGKLRTVSSVSGGSIAAASLATALTRLPQPLTGSVANWTELVELPLRAFTARDRRTGPALKGLFLDWLRSGTGVEALAKVYETDLTPIKLCELPVQPNFILCATDMGYGVNWIFARDQMGDWQAGYVNTPAQWSLGRAVAASSCFPPIFNPLPVGLDPKAYRGGRAPADERGLAIRRDIRLTDGGDYDNLGLEPIWKDHATLLVSDGGAPLDLTQDQGLFWRVQRYVSIVENQAHALRVRWLISNYIAGQMTGTYWGVASATSSYASSPVSGYSKALATEVIAKIRTDLNAFSDAEAAVLQNHGYLLVDAALRTHLPSLVPAGAPTAVAPHPEYMDEAKVRAALRKSS